MIVAMKAVAITALFSAISVLLHSWNEPYGLFLALTLIVVMMRYVSVLVSQSSTSSILRRATLLLTASTWIAIAWIASTARNGDEILVDGDTIGSSFLIGASALVALLLLIRKR